MFRFENPIYLWLLLIIPLMALVRFLSNRNRMRKIRRFGDTTLVKEMMEDVSKYRPAVKFWLLQAALALLIVMLARPQMGTRISREKRQGIEAIICMDISNSMLAEDVVPSRLSKSKLLVENMVDKFVNDKVGLIVYAGDAFVQLPITADYVSAKMFMQNITPSLIASQGTDIAAAISMAMVSFTPDEKADKAIILITDGEDHEGQALEAAQAAKEKGFRVFILGVGTAKGAPIPMPDGSYLTDNAGETVMTRLNEDMCKEIAAAGSGTYIHVDNTSEAQEKLDEEIAKMQKGDVSTLVYSEYDEQFQAVGILVLLLLLIEVILMERENPVTKRIRLFGKKKAAMLILLLVAATAVQAQTDRQYVRSGNKLFRKGVYDKAELEYQKAQSKNENNSQAVYNMGCAMMQQQKDSAAIVQFEAAGKMETNKIRRAMSYHNIGVILQMHQEYAKAIEAYKEALRNNPADHETRYNLELCKRQLKNQQQNKNQQQKQDQNKDQNKDNKDQNKDKNKDQNKDKNQDQNQDQNKQDQDKQEQEQQSQMSKENAERLLDAAVQQEKQTQQRLQKAMQQPQRRRLIKNW